MAVSQVAVSAIVEEAKEMGLSETQIRCGLAVFEVIGMRNAFKGKQKCKTIDTPYSRPSGATTAQQRQSVQGKPCVDCNRVSNPMVADHKKSLVEEYYETGEIDL